ncbi:competence protein ComK [Sporosarcina trichiuri]|uniref:competence protein ComK n=1 Tax=Sporosarcina trichiuri TaxID=3056445 RepID=UPI0025B40751|nr:competence protein ComK [Sporosarcina sp. 0.2-SM1T-5]WJY26381.1 competence protein ComK [Sporosarcina sp. 0.2-SM1T-5]
MKHDSQLVLSKQIEVLMPAYDEAGVLASHRIEADSNDIISYEPSQIVDLNLRLAGSSLRGARDSAELILRSRNKAPLILSRKHGVCLMPFAWCGFPDRGYVNERQVDDYEPNGRRSTTVYMKSGNSIDVPCSIYVFDNSINRAQRLCGWLADRDERICREPKLPVQTFHIGKGAGLNFALLGDAKRRKKEVVKLK